MMGIHPTPDRHAQPGSPQHCPVCRAEAPRPFLRIDELVYWQCPDCEARFLDPERLPSAEVEYAQYCRHENDPMDAGYRRFLSKLAGPLLKRLEPCRSGLDYGCGPGPALAAMFAESGHVVALYDPFFYPDPAALDRQYDFITCTETAEHFHHPAREFDRLDALMRPGAWLGVMTCFQTADARFADWHYRKDPTHVVFYRAATLRRIATQRGWTCEIPVKDVALMQKPSAGSRLQ